MAVIIHPTDYHPHHHFHDYADDDINHFRNHLDYTVLTGGLVSITST